MGSGTSGWQTVAGKSVGGCSDILSSSDRDLSLICRDGTGTPELPRHSPQRDAWCLSSEPDMPTQLGNQDNYRQQPPPYGKRVAPLYQGGYVFVILKC